MTDVFDDEARSEIMRRVKSSGNKSTEQKMVKFFKERGIKGWRRHYKVNGNPDFVFLKEKTAIFVDGCFWHGHDCRNTKPKDNAEYWDKKIARNKKRDADITVYFRNRGWKVIRIWECELKDNLLAAKLDSFLNHSAPSSLDPQSQTPAGDSD
jgi:DNA mismatch endonuclease (patch repair protein)